MEILRHAVQYTFHRLQHTLKYIQADIRPQIDCIGIISQMLYDWSLKFNDGSDEEKRLLLLLNDTPFKVSINNSRLVHNFVFNNKDQVSKERLQTFTKYGLDLSLSWMMEEAMKYKYNETITFLKQYISNKRTFEEQSCINKHNKLQKQS